MNVRVNVIYFDVQLRVSRIDKEETCCFFLKRLSTA